MASLEVIAKLCGVMAEVYRVELTRGFVKTYHALLADISDDDAALAAQAWMAQSQWFPKPSEWRQAALDLSKQPVLDVDEAWSMVLRRASEYGYYYPLELDDKLVEEAARLTGWQEICHSPIEQIGFVRHRFERIYKQLCERTEGERRMLPAVRERVGALRIREAAQLAERNGGDHD